jgi:hypothetical protein
VGDRKPRIRSRRKGIVNERNRIKEGKVIELDSIPSGTS